MTIDSQVTPSETRQAKDLELEIVWESAQWMGMCDVAIVRFCFLRTELPERSIQ
jgi:hypothetical protein